MNRACLLGFLLLAGCGVAVVPLPSGRIAKQGGGGGFPTSAARAVNAVPPSDAATSSRDTTPRPPVPDENSSSAVATPTSSEHPFALQVAAVPLESAEATVRPDPRSTIDIEAAGANYSTLVRLVNRNADLTELSAGATGSASLADPPGSPAAPTADQVKMSGSAADLRAFQFGDAANAAGTALWKTAGFADRLERYDLKAGRSTASITLPDAATLLAVSSDAKMAAVRLSFGQKDGLLSERPFATQTRLDIYDLSGSSGVPKLGFEPLPPGTRGASPVPLGAAFVNEDRLAVLTSDGRVTLWDFARNEAVAATDAVGSSGVGPLLIGPGRTKLGLFVGDGFVVLNADTLEAVGKLPLSGGAADCIAANFSPEGDSIAALIRRPAQSLVTWDLATGKQAKTINAQVPLGRSVCPGVGPGLGFGEAPYLLTGGSLFSSEGPVWRYETDGSCHNVTAAFDRRHWVVLGEQGKAILTALPAPADAVKQLISENQPLPRPLVAPESTVGLQLEVADGAELPPMFQQSLAVPTARAFALRGWRPAERAAATLTLHLETVDTGSEIQLSTGTGELTVPAPELKLSATLKDASNRAVWGAVHTVPTPTVISSIDSGQAEAALRRELWNQAASGLPPLLAQLPTYAYAQPLSELVGSTRLGNGPDDHHVAAAELVAETAGPEMEAGDENSALPVQPLVLVPVQSVGGVVDLAVLPEPLGWLVAASNQEGLRMFEPTNLRKAAEVQDRGGISRVVAGPDGRTVLFGTDDGRVRVFDTNRKNVPQTFTGGGERITAITPTSDSVYAGTAGGTVLMWPLSEDRPSPKSIDSAAGAVVGLVLDADGTRLTVARADGSVRRIELAFGHTVPLAKLSIPTMGIAASPNGQTLALATDRGVKLLSPTNGAAIGQLGTAATTTVQFTGDGTLLAGRRDGSVLAWDIESLQATRRFEGLTGPITALALNGEGNKLAASSATRAEVGIWSLDADGTVE